MVYNTLEDKSTYHLSLFQMYLVSLFNFYYNVIKSMSLSEFRKSPAKIKEVKIFFNSLLSFLS